VSIAGGVDGGSVIVAVNPFLLCVARAAAAFHPAFQPSV